MNDTAQYKEALLKEQQQLTAELETIGIHNPENPSDWIAVPEGVQVTEADPNDAADRVEEWGERRSIVATLETRYNNITRALKKIEDGVYGSCEVCGEVIEEARLKANPAARSCTTHMNEEGTLSA